MLRLDEKLLLFLALVTIWGTGYFVIAQCIDAGWEQGWFGFFRYALAALGMGILVIVIKTSSHCSLARADEETEALGDGSTG